VSGRLVSVIVPFHGSAPYLDEAVRSVLDQTYRPLEVILVSDGSSEVGAEIARRLVAGRAQMRLLHLPDNRGPAAARNRGLEDAAGDFITFLDADDCMVPERIAVQVAHLTDRPQVDIVLGAEELIVEPGAPSTLERREPAGPSFHTMSMMLRPAALERVGRFDPQYRVAEDLDWLFRASAAGLVIEKLDRVLTRHRLHADNLSYRSGEIKAAIVRSLRRQLVIRRKNPHVSGHGHHPVL
jgi:glycosyltransferase involved in cell wall biosynthesis